MFWLHCVRRGEHGPEIADGYHWLLDSTLSLVLLTPVVLVMLPATRSAVDRLGVAARLRRPVQAVLLAGLFSLFTAPGPVVHERLAGYGTPVANLATSFFGRDPTVAHRSGRVARPSLPEECVLQIGVGFPVYAACSWLALRAAAMARSRRLIASGPSGVRGDTGRESP